MQYSNPYIYFLFVSLLTNRIMYHILNRMKVTAIISDNLILELRKYAKGKNLTDSLTIALKEWLAAKRIKELIEIISDKPLEFLSGFSAEKIRNINRK